MQKKEEQKCTCIIRRNAFSNVGGGGWRKLLAAKEKSNSEFLTMLTSQNVYLRTENKTESKENEYIFLK
jgi:hypothetical protein